MAHQFCPGYAGAFATLVKSYPDGTVYPQSAFRTEWGPVFHRGRLNDSARVLVIGQDPAAQENVLRRILVGEAGQRVQGLLAKVGIDKHYVMINALLYSAFDQQAAAPLVNAAGIAAYRNAWLDKLTAGHKITAVATFGNLAEAAFQHWRLTPAGAASGLNSVPFMHPTADAHPPTTTAALLANWNVGLNTLHAAVTPDHVVPLVPYGTSFGATDLVQIPERDLPPGLPAWMRALDPFARRPEPPPQPPLTSAEKTRYKRRHILIEMPATEVP